MRPIGYAVCDRLILRLCKPPADANSQKSRTDPIFIFGLPASCVRVPPCARSDRDRGSQAALCRSVSPNHLASQPSLAPCIHAVDSHPRFVWPSPCRQYCLPSVLPAVVLQTVDRTGILVNEILFLFFVFSNKNHVFFN
jgi:hypothetical protein